MKTQYLDVKTGEKLSPAALKKLGSVIEAMVTSITSKVLADGVDHTVILSTDSGDLHNLHPDNELFEHINTLKTKVLLDSNSQVVGYVPIQVVKPTKMASQESRVGSGGRGPIRGRNTN
jgi:hypothetical protein